jgi:hypothetical protein
MQLNLVLARHSPEADEQFVIRKANLEVLRTEGFAD